MANPYYPPSSTRSAPGYSNPLAVPYSQSHQYPPSSANTNVIPQDDTNYHQFHYDNNQSGPSHQPYNNPFVTVSSSYHQSSYSDDHSTENLVEGAYNPSPTKTGNRIPSPDENGANSYPPFVPSYNNSSSSPPLRPGSPFDGVYPDRPPIYERLNAEQKEIMKQFPKAIDDENGGKSGLQSIKDSLKDWKKYFRLKYLHWWLMLIVLIALVALMTIYHKQIVNWLTPISKKLTSVGWGWIIPVAILFVISFPPLFGHEIVLILVGIVYGLWIGFGIASLGTLIGEIGNFYAFKYCLKSMAAKHERKSIHYACMAEMVRSGGFWVVFLARLSAIPGHFTTAVFATVGMKISVFTLAAILALPKQLLIVYLGVVIEKSGNGEETTSSKVIKYVVLLISVILTVWTAHWLYAKMEKVRPVVQQKLRQKRDELLIAARSPEHASKPVANISGDAVYHLDKEEEDFDRYQPRLGPFYNQQDPLQRQQQQQQQGQSPTSPDSLQNPIQFHRPIRSQQPSAPVQDHAPFQTPPIGINGYQEDSDLSQARANVFQSPPIGGGEDDDRYRRRPELSSQNTGHMGEYQLYHHPLETEPSFHSEYPIGMAPSRPQQPIITISGNSIDDPPAYSSSTLRQQQQPSNDLTRYQLQDHSIRR